MANAVCCSLSKQRISTKRHEKSNLSKKLFSQQGWRLYLKKPVWLMAFLTNVSERLLKLCMSWIIFGLNCDKVTTLCNIQYICTQYKQCVCVLIQHSYCNLWICNVERNTQRLIEWPGCLATQRCLSFVNLHSKKVSDSRANRRRNDWSDTKEQE